MCHGRVTSELVRKTGHIEIVKLLLERGNTPDFALKNRDGETVLDVAKKSNHSEMTDLLRQHGTK